MTDEEFAKMFPTMKWLLPKPPEPSWSELPGNIVPSAVNAATGLYEMVRHPITTLQSLETLAGGTMNLLGADELNAYLADHGLARRRNPQDIAREEATAKAVGQALKDRYWGLDNIKRTMIKDPFGIALDVLGAAAGGAGPVRGVLSVGSKARLAEIPEVALNAERLATAELSPPIAANSIAEVAGDGSNTINKVATGAEEMPKQTFLTKGLEEKRHNYPSDGILPDDPPASLDANKTRIYAPPNRPQRRFDADYPNGVRPDQVDEKGNLLVDKRGKPLESWLTVGRRTLGGDDIGATHEEIRAIGEHLLGKPIEVVPRSHPQLQDRAGRFKYDEKTLEPNGIYIADDLNELKANHIRDHEIGHAIDLETDLPPVPPEVMKELEPVYSTLVSQYDMPRTRPSDRGYVGDKIRHEYVGEGYRGALRNPNYLKTEAPKAYEWLAAQIRNSPKLRKLLVLNGLGAGTVAYLGTSGQNEFEAAEAPPRPNPQANTKRPPLAPATPFEPQDRAASLPTHGFTKLAKALAERGYSTRSTSGEKYKEIVRALANLETKRRSQIYGGPR